MKIVRQKTKQKPSAKLFGKEKNVGISAGYGIYTYVFFFNTTVRKNNILHN